jgi:hypothetical protein
MGVKIFCKQQEFGTHSFFVRHEGRNYYLFSQKYYKQVQDYFAGGVTVSDALDFSKTHRNAMLIKTMQKLPSHIKYIEQEFGITVLKQTAKKRGRSRYDHRKVYHKCGAA